MGRLGPQLLVYEVIMIKLAVTHFNSYFQDHCVLSLTSLEKQGRPGSVRGHLRIQRFNEDPLLCPVAALEEYDRQVLPVWVTKSSCIISLFRCPCSPMKEKHFLSHFVRHMLVSPFRLLQGGVFY